MPYATAGYIHAALIPQLRYKIRSRVYLIARNKTGIIQIDLPDLGTDRISLRRIRSPPHDKIEERTLRLFCLGRRI